MGSLKLKLTIAYHGARYKGWQVQKSGITVQQKVEEALKRFFPSVDRVHSSSRTDTGVHARGMVAHVEVQKDEFRIGELKLRLALNAFLPDDVSVTEVKRVPGNFHARFDATGKQYRYMIWNHPALNPLQREVSWHVPRELDFLRMQEGAKFFIGNHDFRAFAVKREYEMRSTIRVVSNCKLYKKESMLTCLIEGEGFLYRCVEVLLGHWSKLAWVS